MTILAARLSRRPAFVLASLGLAAAAGCASQPLAGPDAIAPMAPMPGITSAPEAKSTGRPSLDTPVATICAYPGGKAVLDRDLPGLTEHPDFFMFKMLSLKKLADISNGQLTPAKLDAVRADLNSLP